MSLFQGWEGSVCLATRHCVLEISEVKGPALCIALAFQAGCILLHLPPGCQWMSCGEAALWVCQVPIGTGAPWTALSEGALLSFGHKELCLCKAEVEACLAGAWAGLALELSEGAQGLQTVLFHSQKELEASGDPWRREREHRKVAGVKGGGGEAGRLNK